MPIIAKIDVMKFDKTKFFTGKEKNGHTPKYSDLVLIENTEGTDQYGNDGFVVQGVTKEDRDKGVKGAILGNWKHVGEKKRPEPPKQQSRSAQNVTPDNEDDDIPF